MQGMLQQWLTTVWSHSSKNESGWTRPEYFTDTDPLGFLRITKKYEVQLNIYTKVHFMSFDTQKARKDSKSIKDWDVKCQRESGGSFQTELWRITCWKRREVSSEMDLLKGQVSGRITLYSPLCFCVYCMPRFIWIASAWVSFCFSCSRSFCRSSSLSISFFFPWFFNLIFSVWSQSHLFFKWRDALFLIE